MIYFLRSGNKVKIGYTSKPTHRISSIQTSHPYQLEILLIIDGNKVDEFELHGLLSEHKYRGEWFEYSETIKQFIYDNMPNDRRYEFGFIGEGPHGNEQVYRLRKEHRLSLRQVGERLGITPQSVKEIQEREKTGTVSLNVLKSVANALGYRFEYRFVKREDI